MSSKRRTLWRGSLELSEDEELDIAVATHQPSLQGQETFDWKIKNDEASLVRLPRSCLSKPNDLRTFLRGSSLVEVIEYSGRLKQLLSRKIFAVLTNEDTKVTPLVVMFSKEEQIIVGFCVAGEETQDQEGVVNSFTMMLEENIATLPPNATNIPKPSDIPDSKEVEEAKKKIVDKFLNSIEFKEPILKFGENEFKYTRHAEWRMDVHEEDITYLSIFVESGQRELMIFSETTSSHPPSFPSTFTVETAAGRNGKLTYPGHSDALEVRLIEDLSSFEEHFLRMGRGKEASLMMIEAGQLETFFASFERKHGSKVMIVPKLDEDPAHITCIVTSEETQRRLEALENEQPERPDLVDDEEEKKPCNPDEIIDGRPKWSKIRQKRKGKPKKKKLPLEDIDADEEESDQLDELDFDRLNPHRIFIPELDDNFENKNGEYQKVALKMMADLQVDTFVPIGDSRLDLEVEARARREMEEWEELKVKYSLVVDEEEDEAAGRQICQRKKTGGKVKNNKRSILAKTMRKIAI